MTEHKGVIRDFQLPLFGGLNTSQIVNVASVPQRSPFRYPGGKTWLVPFVRQWLISLPQRPAEFIEPFAGGAIVGLSVAFERLVDQVTLVELDEQEAAVWNTIIYGDYEWLAEKSFVSTLLTRMSIVYLRKPKSLPRKKHSKRFCEIASIAAES